MEKRPSDKCEDCFWWQEDPFLCEGCPNNPKPDAERETDRPEARAC